MIHDILISVGVYSIFQFEVTPGTVIAFLTILGFSLYDTIVVYDKVADNTRRLTTGGKLTYSEMMNLSLNQVIMRSINTTLTALLPVLSILVIGAYALGAVALEEFGLALLIGLFVGAYSRCSWPRPSSPTSRSASPGTASSAPGSRSGGRVSRHRPRPWPPPAPTSGSVVDDVGGDGVPRASAKPKAASPSTRYSANHPPRPRKKGKKR